MPIADYQIKGRFMWTKVRPLCLASDEDSTVLETSEIDKRTVKTMSGDVNVPTSNSFILKWETPLIWIIRWNG
jgi:hypothetical protein